jgi:hypothetical protein
MWNWQAGGLSETAILGCALPHHTIPLRFLAAFDIELSTPERVLFRDCPGIETPERARLPPNAEGGVDAPVQATNQRAIMLAPSMTSSMASGSAVLARTLCNQEHHAKTLVQPYGLAALELWRLALVNVPSEFQS